MTSSGSGASTSTFKQPLLLLGSEEEEEEETVVLVVDHNNSISRDQEYRGVPTTSTNSTRLFPSTTERLIVVCAGIYTVLIIYLFTYPRYVSKHWQGDGLSLISKMMGIIFETFFMALLLSIIALCATVARWNRLSLPLRMLGLYPIICSFIIIVVVAIIMSSIEHSEEDGRPECPTTTEDGEDCPTPKK